MPQRQPVTLSVDQALEQAIRHHQAGRLQEAEQLYRAVLRVNPNHPDANYNLGALAVHINQPGGGLGHFKAALEANPNQPQYWLSYIDALVLCGQHETAARVLDQAKRRGLQGDALDTLAERVKVKTAGNAQEPDIGEKYAFRELCDRGRYSEAEALARSMTQRFPGEGEGWKALGVAINLQGRPADALTAMQQAVKLLPGDAEAPLKLGRLLFDLGHYSESETAYRQALLIAPDSAEARNNLGFLLQRLNRYEQAESEYRHALRVDPSNVTFHYNLGNLLYFRNRCEEAVSAYQQALRISPNFAEAHHDLGNVLVSLGRPEEAIASYRCAIELTQNAPDKSDTLIAARIGMSNALARMVPLWHAPMMNDDSRNRVYLEALRSAVTSKTRVFEIGTGSGLLAMMAARCGAERVTTCEVVPLIARAAREIIADNGLASSIQVIEKKSAEINVGVELSQPANLLISEIFANDLLGEGLLPSIEDAKQRLLEPGAAIIPAAASIFFALFGGEEVGANLMVADVCGFNLSKFNAIIQQRLTLLRQDLKIELLTDGIEAFCFDFEANSYFPTESKTLRVPIKTSGLCHGIIQWIRLKLDQTNTYENHPCSKTTATGWGSLVSRFPASIPVAAGQTATIRASHNRRNSFLSFEGLE